MRSATATRSASTPLAASSYSSPPETRGPVARISAAHPGKRDDSPSPERKSPRLHSSHVKSLHAALALPKEQTTKAAPSHTAPPETRAPVAAKSGAPPVQR